MVAIISMRERDQAELDAEVVAEVAVAIAKMLGGLSSDEGVYPIPPEMAYQVRGMLAHIRDKAEAIEALVAQPSFTKAALTAHGAYCADLSKRTEG